jgi:hypothetical protein
VTVSMAFTAFKVAMLGGNTRIDLDADVIKVRIGSNSDLAAAAPQATTMSGIPKYLASTDQVATSPQILTTVPGGFDQPSTVAFDIADMNFPAIAADAGKSIDWVVFFKFVTNDSDSMPLWIMTGFQPIVPASSAISVKWGSGVNRTFSMPV